MFYFFEIPEILDSVVLKNVMKGGFADDSASNLITHAEEVRAMMKKLLSKGIDEYLKNGRSLSNFADKLNEYLIVQTDVAEFFARNACNGLPFKYKSFLSRDQEISAKSNEIEQTMMTEIIMTRFAFAVFLSFESSSPLQDIYNNIGQTFEAHKVEKQETLQTLVNSCLNLNLVGVKKLIKLENSIPDLMASIKSETHAELNGECLKAAIRIFIIGTASLQLENLRFLKEFKAIAGICKKFLREITQCYSVLFPRKDSIKSNILPWLEIANVFFEGYMTWALMRDHDWMISVDDWSQGKFPSLVREFQLLSNRLMNISNKLSSLNVDKSAESYVFATTLFNGCFLPFANFKIQTYSGVKIDQQLRSRSPEELISAIKERPNFFEQI